MDGYPSRFTWWAILLLALVVRLGAGVWWQERLPAGQRFFFPDSESYWQLGRTIAHGEPYQYGVEQARIFRTPGYPLLLAPIFLIGGDAPSPYAARAMSAIFGTCSVAIIMAFGSWLFNARAAALAGLAAALEPGTISQGVFVLSEAPFSPLMLLHLGAWLLAWKANDARHSVLHAAWGGVVGALATLMRPSWLLFLPFAGLLTLLVGQQRKKQLLIVGVMSLTFAVTMAPWWWRNYQLTGRFIPTSLQVGASLYDGLSPQANGGSEMSFVPKFMAEQQVFDAAASTPPTDTFEERLDQRMKSASIAWAAANPGRVLELMGIKFVRMWTPWPNASDVGGTGAKLAIAVGYLPLIITGICGAGRYIRRDATLLLLALPAIYFTLLHIVFVSSLRYRQPALLPLFVFGAAWAIEKINHSNLSLNKSKAEIHKRKTNIRKTK